MPRDLTVGQIVMGGGVGLLLMFLLGWGYAALADEPLVTMVSAFLFLIPGAIVTPLGFLWWLLELLSPKKAASRPPND